MELPVELAREVGSFLSAQEVQMCIAQLCNERRGVCGISAHGWHQNDTIQLYYLIACCRPPKWKSLFMRDSSKRASIVRKAIKRIEVFLARFKNGAKRRIVFVADLDNIPMSERMRLTDICRQIQVASCDYMQSSEEMGITIEWHVMAYFIAEVQFIIDHVQATEDAHVENQTDIFAFYNPMYALDMSWSNEHDISPLAACRSLHTVNLSGNLVTNISAAASWPLLRTLNLNCTQVSDLSVLASCQSLHTLNLADTRVSDVSALASCPSLHTLSLARTQVDDVSALASCHSLHSVDLLATEVHDVTPLASCRALHTLVVAETPVSDVSALASCPDLDTVNLDYTRVSDVSALASCSSLRILWLQNTLVSDVSALATCRALRKLFLRGSGVTDVSALASCESLDTLSLSKGQVADVSVLESFPSLCYVHGNEVLEGHVVLLNFMKSRRRPTTMR
jgi:hypothetical protein